MCPHCGEPMIILELEGIEIDFCVSCGGTWLDTGELELIAELENVETGRLTIALYESPTQERSERRCPRCRTKMDQFQIGKQTSIELERCPNGHGTWLDKGETEAVIASFKEGEEGIVAGFFADLYKARK